MHTAMDTVAIEARGLVKQYGTLRAVDQVSFTVAHGEIFGLLGPNGAGKTTTLSIIEGLQQADAGEVSVLGLNGRTQSSAIKRRIGVQLQSTSLLPELTAIEQVELFARLYGRRLQRKGARELLEQVALQEKAHALPGQLSGGQGQRLALALALVNDPEVLFLDEPTAGLDPQARRSLWDLLRALRDQGRTIVLTTHYMEEAEVLCERIGIIDCGRLLALDTPGGLINRLGGISTISTTASLPLEAVERLPGVTAVSRANEKLLRIQSNNSAASSSGLLELARQLGQPLTDLHLQQPGLEDAFLQLTGRQIREE